jgi:N-6 DNA Methylase
MSCSSTRPSISKRASDRTTFPTTHIEKIIDTYQQRPKSVERYARRVEMDEIEANDFNLNISRYVNTAMQEVAIDLSATHRELVEIEKQVRESTAKHNAFLKGLGLSPMQRPISKRRDPSHSPGEIAIRPAIKAALFVTLALPRSHFRNVILA